MELLSEWMYKQHTPDKLVGDILHLITVFKLHGQIDSKVVEASYVSPISAQLWKAVCLQNLHCTWITIIQRKIFGKQVKRGLQVLYQNYGY